RIPGPTQPTVVRELVAVGEPSYTALPAGLPHHPRPQRGGSSRTTVGWVGPGIRELFINTT
ncbi:hypothetical protein FVP47_11800, partial [Mycobacterium tuberculosis]|nr:hypothetical protein [Mycobacterium tuberculosis]